MAWEGLNLNENHDLLTVFKNHEINDFAVVLFKKEFVLYEHKLKRLGFLPRSIIICLFPSCFGDIKSPAFLSRYALAKDYHIIIEEILKNACKDLKEIYKDNSFKYFVDNSPFLEKDMACFSGLCIKGKHDVCINDKYGSRFFIGEIVTGFEFEEKFGNDNTVCCEAMTCISACPTGAIYIDQNNNAKFIKERCLSYISQKKAFSGDDEKLFLKAKSIWGCDLCQDACVKNKGIKKTHIKEFLKLMPDISLDKISRLSDKEFKQEYADRVFSWKGKKVIERNLKILDNNIDNT